jgi:hypothetical protein
VCKYTVAKWWEAARRRGAAEGAVTEGSKRAEAGERAEGCERVEAEGCVLCESGRAMRATRQRAVSGRRPVRGRVKGGENVGRCGERAVRGRKRG